MKYILVDKEQWVVVDPGTKPIAMLQEDWDKIDIKARSTIRLCLLDLVLLNIFGEYIAKNLWDKLGSLYQSKTLVNKLFLTKKLYLLRMEEGDSVKEHLNAFNNVISQLVSVDIDVTEE